MAPAYPGDTIRIEFFATTEEVRFRARVETIRVGLGPWSSADVSACRDIHLGAACRLAQRELSVTIFPHSTDNATSPHDRIASSRRRRVSKF